MKEKLDALRGLPGKLKEKLKPVTKKLISYVKPEDEPVLRGEDDFDFVPGQHRADDPFEASLDTMLPEDIDVKNKGPKTKKTPAEIVRTVILVFLICVVIGCAAFLIYDIVGQKSGDDFYDKLAEDWENILVDGDDGGGVKRLQGMTPANVVLCMKDRISAGDTPEITVHDARIDEMRAKLTSLSVNFPDLYGWIYIENTAINYPLVKGYDNDYYLDHAPDRSSLVNGSVFVDYRNNATILRNFNTVMYGHNLVGGGMFHDVEKFYKDEEFFKNTLIYIYTLDGAYVYKPFAVYDTNYEYQYFRTEFMSTDDFIAFANEMHANSKWHSDVTFGAADRMITMSTCTNGASWGRYSLQAKLVQIIG